MDVRGSIRLSPRYGLSTPYRLTIRKSARLFHHVLFNMGDLHLFLPALNLSTLNAGILIMMQQIRLMMLSLNMVDYSISFLLLSTWNFFNWQVGGTIDCKTFLLFEPGCTRLGLRSLRNKVLGTGLDNNIKCKALSACGAARPVLPAACGSSLSSFKSFLTV